MQQIMRLTAIKKYSLKQLFKLLQSSEMFSNSLKRIKCAVLFLRNSWGFSVVLNQLTNSLPQLAL